MEAGFNGLVPDVLEFVRSLGRQISSQNATNHTEQSSNNEDENADIILQTLDDVVSSASGQPLSTVSSSHFANYRP